MFPSKRYWRPVIINFHMKMAFDIDFVYRFRHALQPSKDSIQFYGLIIDVV